jgi:predicted DNA binding CopG/RHH family protein
MSDPKLSQEEQALLGALEAGEYESVLTDAIKKALAASAAHALQENQCINIHLSNRDVMAIQMKVV